MQSARGLAPRKLHEAHVPRGHLARAIRFSEIRSQGFSSWSLCSPVRKRTRSYMSVPCEHVWAGAGIHQTTEAGMRTSPRAPKCCNCEMRRDEAGTP